MIRRVPVTLCGLSDPRRSPSALLADRIRACQGCEVLLLTGPGREHPALYRLLDGLSELRLSTPTRNEIGASSPICGPARANLSLF